MCLTEKILASDDYYNEIRKIISKCRKKKRITQKKISEMIGYSRSYISDFERGVMTNSGMRNYIAAKCVRVLEIEELSNQIIKVLKLRENVINLKHEVDLYTYKIAYYSQRLESLQSDISKLMNKLTEEENTYEVYKKNTSMEKMEKN